MQSEEDFPTSPVAAVSLTTCGVKPCQRLFKIQICCVHSIPCSCTLIGTLTELQQVIEAGFPFTEAPSVKNRKQTLSPKLKQQIPKYHPTTCSQLLINRISIFKRMIWKSVFGLKMDSADGSVSFPAQILWSPGTSAGIPYQKLLWIFQPWPWKGSCGPSYALDDTHFQFNLAKVLSVFSGLMPNNRHSCLFLKPAVTALAPHPLTQQRYVAMYSFQ